MTTSTAGEATVPRAVRGVGLLLHLLTAVFPLSASGLVAPLWAIVLLYVAWAALGLALWRASRTRPPLMLLGAPGVLALWFAALTAGERLLGWTA